MSENVSIVNKAYKYRIYPTKEQEVLINKTFGSCRFVYNFYLNKKIQSYELNKTILGYNECANDLTLLKKELTWLKEVDSTALQATLKDLDIAYKNFFKGNAKYPKFKSKKNPKNSYTTRGRVKYLGDSIFLPKLGEVHTINNLQPEGRILFATISKESSGKYYVSFNCEKVIVNHLDKNKKVVGIDLGIKEYLTTSDGLVVENPKFYRNIEQEIKELEKILAKKEKGSSNYNKIRIKIAKKHEKVKNQRTDFINKLTTSLVKDYDIICIEDLQVKNMIKNHNLAKAIQDVSWSEFVRQLEYKAQWYGKKIVKVDTFYASSQTCNCCGNINPNIRNLKIRNWTCETCNTHHDRDINAAINILNKGLKQLNEVA